MLPKQPKQFAPVNVNARDRALAAHAAAARHGKVSPYESRPPSVPSRPSSAKPSRPSSGTGKTSPKRSIAGKESQRSPRIPWGVNFSVPRSFVEIAAGQHIDWLELQLGPKELKFRELGAKLEAEALEAAAREAVLSRNGAERRRRAETAVKENRNSTGEPWRHGRHGGHGGHGEAPAGGPGPPLHLPSRKTGASDGTGLFSSLSPLEATESALRYRELMEARSRRASRPASAPVSRGTPSRRQKLETQFEELITELQKRFEQHSADELFIISDLDVSQNKLSLDQFQTLFTVLSYPNVCVERFRMFGCPTLNDGVMQIFSDYLRRLAPDCAPLELHLSDCAVTSEGFGSLCGALEETQLYPKANSQSPTMGTPLYLRLENNYITEEHIKEKVDAGVLRHWNKLNAKTAPLSGGAKANLVVKGNNYGQKEGTPPSPEEAPPPKQIFDRNNPAQQQQDSWNNWMWMMQFGSWGGTKGKGKGGMQKGGVTPMTPWPGLMAGKGKSKGKTRPQSPQKSDDNQWQNQSSPSQWPNEQSQSSWNGQQSQSSWQNQSWQSNQDNQDQGWKAWDSKSPWQDQGGWQNDKAKDTSEWSSWKDKSSDPWSGSGTSQGQSWQKDQGSTQQPNQDWKRQDGGRGWNSKGSEDRSRTPAPRSKSEVEEKPPPPWEIHWSDEYRLKYYWNSETGESFWEKPEKW